MNYWVSATFKRLHHEVICKLSTTEIFIHAYYQPGIGVGIENADIKAHDAFLKQFTVRVSFSMIKKKKSKM